MQGQQFALRPTDVAYVAILLALIEGGRKSTDSFQFNDIMTPLQVLCFLGDRIDLQSVKHYSTALLFLEDVMSYFVNNDEEKGDWGRRSTTDHPFTAKVLGDLQRVQSIDDLIEFVDSIRSIFESDVSISPNEVMAPNRICPDSSLGIFSRSFIAKWDCLPFDSVCQLYEAFRIFVSSGESHENHGYQNSSAPTFENDSSFSASQNSDDDCIGVHRFLQQAEVASESGDVYAAEKLLHRYFDFNGNDPLLSVASKGSAGVFSSLYFLVFYLTVLSFCMCMCYTTNLFHNIIPANFYFGFLILTVIIQCCL